MKGVSWATVLMILLAVLAIYFATTTVVLQGRVEDMCSLKVILPKEGPTDLEAFVNAQTFAWCGDDPYGGAERYVRVGGDAAET